MIIALETEQPSRTPPRITPGQSAFHGLRYKDRKRIPEISTDGPFDLSANLKTRCVGFSDQR